MLQDRNKQTKSLDSIMYQKTHMKVKANNIENCGKGKGNPNLKFYAINNLEFVLTCLMSYLRWRSPAVPQEG